MDWFHSKWYGTETNRLSNEGTYGEIVSQIYPSKHCLHFRNTRTCTHSTDDIIKNKNDIMVNKRVDSPIAWMEMTWTNATEKRMRTRGKKTHKKYFWTGFERGWSLRARIT